MTDRAAVLAHAEGSRLAILENAWVKALDALNKCADPRQTAALAQAEAAAKRSLEAARAAAMAEPTPPATLTGYVAAAAYLERHGWRVSKSKLDRDLKRGRLGAERVKGEWVFTLDALDAYGRGHCRPAAGEREDEVLARLAREKLEEEVRHRRALAERTEVENRVRAGELIPRAAVERELTARALVLKADISNWAHEAPAAIVELVGGRADAVHELQAHLVEGLDEALDRYADEREFVAILTRHAGGEAG